MSWGWLGQGSGNTDSGSGLGGWLGGLVFGDNSGSGGNTSDYLKWLQTIYGIYQDQRAPRYSTPPMTDQQKQLWDLYIGGLTNPAFKNNATEANNIIHQRLASMNPSWNAPKTSKGETGYSGSPMLDPSKFNFAPAGNATPDPNSSPAGGLPSGATGSPSQPLGAGGTFPGLGGYPGQMGTTPNTATNMTGDELANFIHSYGKSAVEAALALMTQNPGIGARAAFDAVRAHFASQPPQNLPSSNPNYPQGILAPGNQGQPVPSLNTPYDQWFGKPPETTTPFNPRYAGNAGPGYYDPKGGAGAIAGLLGGQMGSSDGRGPKKF